MITYNFTGKTVIVSGAGSGIGRVTSLAFLDAGANVIFANRSEKPNLIKSIKKYENRAMFFKCDTSKEDEVIDLVSFAVKCFGTIHILINNVGVSKGNTIEDTSVAEWDWIMSTNVKSYFLCTKHVSNVMKIQKYGKIVNVSSIAGRDRSMLLGASYTTSKAAILGFTKHMSSEFAKFNINVNAVCPSQTNTPMLKKLLTPEINEMLLKKIPLGYIQEPEQVAKLILFLASDDSNYMTGSIVDINGGLL